MKIKGHIEIKIIDFCSDLHSYANGFFYQDYFTNKKEYLKICNKIFDQMFKKQKNIKQIGDK